MNFSKQEQKIQVKSELPEVFKAETVLDEKCPVCLQHLSSSRAFTSTCSHTFCFECIFQWSQIKYNCPLCKQPYDRIIFSPVKHLEFNEFLLPLRDDNEPLYDPLEIIENPDTNQISKASWLIGKEQSPVVFRMLVYLKKWYAYPHQSQFYSDLSDLKKLFNDKEFQLPVATNQDKFICYQRVERFRDISWQWHAQNVACTHRLMNFIHRELKALTCVLKQSYSKLPGYLNINMRARLMAIIVNKLKTVNIGDAAFLDVIKEFITPMRLAKHFQHELECYAKSTSSTLADYDAKCVYYNYGITPQTDPENNLPKTLPVNLVKYRIFTRLNLAFNDQDNIDNSVVEFDDEEIENTVNNDQMSDTSSFCEELEVTPKPSPQYILISSSRSRSTTRSRSKSPSSSRYNKLKKHYSRSPKPSRSKSPSSSRQRRLKKQRSKSRSMSIESLRKKIKKLEKKKHRKSSKTVSITRSQSNEESFNDSKVKHKEKIKKKKRKKKKSYDKQEDA